MGAFMKEECFMEAEGEMDGLFQKITEECKKTGFLETVLEKAHYAPEDRELLWSVLEQVLQCMEGEACWSAKAIDTRASGARKESCDKKAVGVKAIGAGEAGVQAVVMTLGAGVDQLQEEMLVAGKLTEAYMVEVLGSEILLLAYTAFNTWVKEHTDFVVKRYYFLGMGEYVTIRKVDQDDMVGEQEGENNKLARIHTETVDRISLELATLPDMLKRSGLPVTCTEGYCMLPKKSVAFYAELTRDKAVICEGICMGCGRKDCPNRMEVGERTRGNRTLDRPLTYGYARILGLRES